MESRGLHGIHGIHGIHGLHGAQGIHEIHEILVLGPVQYSSEVKLGMRIFDGFHVV